MRTKNCLALCVWAALVIVAFSQQNEPKTSNESLTVVIPLTSNLTTVAPLTAPTKLFNEVTANSNNITEAAMISSGSTTTLAPIAPPTLTAEMNVPASCANRALSPHQPEQTGYSALLKCCPIGQNFVTDEQTKTITCQESKYNLDISKINAVFYEKCIEDLETNLSLKVIHRDPCSDKHVVYGNFTEERLYIIQNGSLLVIDSGYAWSELFTDYCVEVDVREGKTLAYVCHQTIVIAGGGWSWFIFSICMLISVPFLLAVTFFYLRIKELRDLRGKCLACLSFSLACGFLLMSVTQLGGKSGHEMPKMVGYLAQFFFLSYFFWLLAMFIDTSLHLWIFFPRLTKLTETQKLLHFIGYIVLATGIPILLVLLTISQNLTGTPPFFLKNSNALVADSQRFFVNPVSFIMFACFFILISWYFGFKAVIDIKVRGHIISENIKGTVLEPEMKKTFINRDDFDDFSEMTKRVVFLFIVMALNWIFEIISFYGNNSYALFDALISLQGVMIFIVFTLLKSPKRIISSWYKDSGSLSIPQEGKEMQPLNH